MTLFAGDRATNRGTAHTVAQTARRFLTGALLVTAALWLWSWLTR